MEWMAKPQLQYPNHHMLARLPIRLASLPIRLASLLRIHHIHASMSTLLTPQIFPPSQSFLNSITIRNHTNYGLLKAHLTSFYANIKSGKQLGDWLLEESEKAIGPSSLIPPSMLVNYIFEVKLALILNESSSLQLEEISLKLNEQIKKCLPRILPEIDENSPNFDRYYCMLSCLPTNIQSKLLQTCGGFIRTMHTSEIVLIISEILLSNLSLPTQFMLELNENEMYFNMTKLGLCHLKYRFISKYMGSFATPCNGQFNPFLSSLTQSSQKQVNHLSSREFSMILDILIFQFKNISNISLSKDIKIFTLTMLAAIRRISGHLSIADIVMYHERMQQLLIDLTQIKEEILERRKEIVVTKETTPMARKIVEIMMKECSGVLLYNKIEGIGKNYVEEYVRFIETLVKAIIPFDHTIIIAVLPILHDLEISKEALKSIHQIYLADMVASVKPHLPQYFQFLQFCHFHSFNVESDAETILGKLIPLFLLPNLQLQYAEPLYRLTHIITSGSYKCRTDAFSQLKPKLQQFYKSYSIKNGPCNTIDSRLKYIILLGFLIRSPLKIATLSNFNFFLNDYLLDSIHSMVGQEVIVALAYTAKAKVNKNVMKEAIPKLFQNVTSLCIYCNSDDKTYLNPRYAPHFNTLLNAALQYSDFKPTEDLQYYLFVQTLFKQCYTERTENEFLTVLNFTGEVSNLCPELRNALKSIAFADDLDVSQKKLIDNFLDQNVLSKAEPQTKKKKKKQKKSTFKSKEEGSDKQILDLAVRTLKEKEGIDKQVIEALRDKNIKQKQIASIFANKQVYLELITESSLDPICKIPEPIGNDKVVEMAYICLKIYQKIRKENDFSIESFMENKQFAVANFEEELDFIQRKGSVQMTSLNSFHIQKRKLTFLSKIEAWNTHYKVSPKMEIKKLALNQQLLEKVLERVVFGIMGNQQHLMLACQFFKINSKLAFIMTGRPYTVTGALIETGNLKLLSADRQSFKLIYICAYLLARKGSPVCIVDQHDDFGKLKRHMATNYPIEDEMLPTSQINDHILLSSVPLE